MPVAFTSLRTESLALLRPFSSRLSLVVRAFLYSVYLQTTGGQEVGWDKIRESFEQVAQNGSDGQIKLSDQIIQISGDMAYEVGFEQGQAKVAREQIPIEHRVTNIYRQEAKSDIFEYIEIFYNRQRRPSALHYLLPVDYEALFVAS